MYIFTMDQIATNFKLFSDSSAPAQRLSESVSVLFDTRYLYGFVMLVCFGLLYFMREKVGEVYEEYVQTPLHYLFGEWWLRMHLSSAGEYVSTYVPDTGGFVALSDLFSSEELAPQ